MAKIVTKEQFRLLPIGTVYTLYNRECFEDQKEVYYKDDVFDHADGTLDMAFEGYLTPQFKDEIMPYDIDAHIGGGVETELMANDTNMIDFDEDQLFIVYNIDEIQAMIDCLKEQLDRLNKQGV